MYQQLRQYLQPAQLSYQVELPGGPGETRIRESKGGFATGKEAVDARAEVLQQYERGRRSIDGKQTLGEWLEKWLAAKIERGALRGDTAEVYRDDITLYLVPHLGHIRLVELRGGHLTRAYDAMRRDRNRAIVEVEKINDQRAGRGGGLEPHQAFQAARGCRTWWPCRGRSGPRPSTGSTPRCPPR